MLPSVIGGPAGCFPFSDFIPQSPAETSRVARLFRHICCLSCYFSEHDCLELLFMISECNQPCCEIERIIVRHRPVRRFEDRNPLQARGDSELVCSVEVIHQSPPVSAAPEASWILRTVESSSSPRTPSWRMLPSVIGGGGCLGFIPPNVFVFPAPE
jgi:hypothetical protein